MIKQLEIKVFPDKLHDRQLHEQMLHSQLKAYKGKVRELRLIRRSIDSRGSRPLYILRYEAYIDEPYTAPEPVCHRYRDVSGSQRVIIVGSGPAGYFAALQCLEEGFKPLVLERGKDVRARRRDLRALQQEGVVHPDSNYCFGEGGAGTYSDGKLYTRSGKRGPIEKVLHILHEHGATEDILIDAHPHIGSNKLPNIIAAIRHTIEKFGGEVRFESRVTDLLVSAGKIKGVMCGTTEYMAEDVILATGHSARDIYYLLYNKGIKIEAKPFALGLRIEHSQSFIDKVRYHQENREENLPASSYAVVSQVQNKGVFSFCMCPGGLVVPAATAPGEIVVNGMSLSRRDSPYANSGYVTSIEPEELEALGYKGPLACLEFQAEVEHRMFVAGDGSQKAPAQRVLDFVQGIPSAELNPTSYIPGLLPAPLHDILPGFVYKRLRDGLLDANKKMKGFITNDANIIGVESRTSSPVRIPRDADSYLHPGVDGLYPCGEGAGYAGGIVSAALDGQNVVLALAKNKTLSV